MLLPDIKFVAKTAALMSLLFLIPGCPRLSPNVDRTRDLVYGVGYVKDNTADSGYRLQKLRFDLLEPTDVPASNRPAVLMIHGGSFAGGSKADEDLVNVADGLASEGYVCFLIDYRVDSDEPPVVDSWNPEAQTTKDIEIPSLAAVRAAFVDAKTAMRHIRANSGSYGIDPNRIAIWGESAG
ncbi:MAG: alpha/beta hydrolase, partial [Candidatus Hydrogenedentes bacterium]|nr:alpha/beta hydrolase [Candidatus Hydrogenedentota bacterium]